MLLMMNSNAILSEPRFKAEEQKYVYLSTP